MLQEEEKRRVLGRLRRIRGQVGGLERMVDEDQYCVDVLHQVAAVRGALSEVARAVLRAHLNTCVHRAMRSRDPEEQQRVIEELVEVFGRSTRSR